LDRAKPQVALALPRHLDADRLLRVAMTAIMRTPKLLECDQQSLLGAIMQAAQLGLEPDGVLGHAYLVPFKGKVTLIAGYKGLIDLARRSGAVVSIQAHVVYEADEFDYSYGLQDCLRHKPALRDRGRPIAAYAAAVLKDGGHAFEVMSVEDVNAIRDNSQGYKAAKQYGGDSPWDSNWDEMARKTAVRRLAKYLPISVEFQRAAAHGELFDAGVHPDMDLIDAPPEPPRENEAEVAALLSRLAAACPATYPEPPAPEALAEFITKTAAANASTRTVVLNDALGQPEGFFVSFWAWVAKNGDGGPRVLKEELKARTEMIDPNTGEVLSGAPLFGNQAGA
jgi:recombination protein RecT